MDLVNENNSKYYEWLKRIAVVVVPLAAIFILIYVIGFFEAIVQGIFGTASHSSIWNKICIITFLISFIVYFVFSFAIVVVFGMNKKKSFSLFLFVLLISLIIMSISITICDYLLKYSPYSTNEEFVNLYETRYLYPAIYVPSFVIICNFTYMFYLYASVQDNNSKKRNFSLISILVFMIHAISILPSILTAKEHFIDFNSQCMIGPIPSINFMFIIGVFSIFLILSALIFKSKKSKIICLICGALFCIFLITIYLILDVNYTLVLGNNFTSYDSFTFISMICAGYIGIFTAPIFPLAYFLFANYKS